MKTNETRTDYRALCAELLSEIQALRRAVADEVGCSSPEPSVIARARAALAQPEPQGPMPEVDDILRLAAIIRRVDGNHDKGAAALAEAILSHPDSRWQHAQPEPQGPMPTDEELMSLYGVETSCYHGFLAEEFRQELDFARAVLARWGTPTNTINQED
jgi:hypothetical protein